MDRKIVAVFYVPTMDMLADKLTKALAKDRHHNHAERIGLDLCLAYSCTNCKTQFDTIALLNNHTAEVNHGEVFTVNAKKRKYES